MIKIEERRPFRINYKSKKDQTIFEYRNKSVRIFFRGYRGWSNVSSSIYDRVWRDIQSKGITYYSRRELEELAGDMKNGDELLYGLSKNCN